MDADAPRSPARRPGPFLKFLIGLVLLGAAVGIGLSYLVTNPFTPAGAVGYIYEEPRAWGAGGYRGLVEGPGSFGGSLKRHRVVNIELGPRPYRGSLAYSQEGGVVEAEWEVRMRPDPKSIKAVVEEFDAGSWYERHVDQLVGHAMRGVLEEAERVGLPGLEEAARAAVEHELAARKMPFVVEGFLIRRLVDPRAEVLAATKPEEEGGRGSEALADAPSGARGPKVVEGAVPVSAVPDEMWVMPEEATLIDVSHRREFRAMWMATVSNVDWPSRSGLDAERQKEELVRYLDGMEAMNMNALVFQVRGAADAFYQSELEPWSTFLTGEQGKDPGYDPLAFVIEECRKRSIELHAWFNPFRAMPVEDYEVAENHITKLWPSYARPYASMMWMDPGAKEVRDRVVEVVLDVVRRYDVDGIHIDDYFYPYPKNGEPFNDEVTYRAHLECCGQIEKDDWRRQNVDTLIATLEREIREEKPHVKFGVSPFGLYRPGEPEGTKGFDQFDGIYSDPKKWLEKGWIDYVTPQLYWRESSNRSYSALLQWWGETNVLRRHIYAGNSLLSIERGKGSWPFSEFETQLKESRKAIEYQSLGNVFFGMRVFRGEQGERLQDRFRKELYPEPALPPAMPWLGNRPPEQPGHVRVVGNELRWDGATAPHLKNWTIYRREDSDGSWNLQGILPAATTRMALDPGDYAVCAVDCLRQESIGVRVQVAEAPPEDASEGSEPVANAGD